MKRTEQPLNSKSNSPERTRSISSEVNCNSQSSQLSEVDLPSSQDGFFECSSPLNLSTEYQQKIKDLRQVLESDLLGCDAKWTLFVAAALSYRYNCTLKPFPPRFIQEIAGLQIDALVSAINETPNLKVLFQNIINQSYEDIHLDAIDLLHWVLVTMRDPYLRLLDEDEVRILLQSVQGKQISLGPSFVFEVVAAKGFHSDEEFHARAGNNTFKLAFFGQTLDSFFSILHNGFYSSKFEPIHMSTDLFSSVQHSPCDPAWGASQCGSFIACAALCEFTCETGLAKITTNARDKCCVDVELKDPNKMRARYLFFFGCRYPKEHRSQEAKTGIAAWIARHKYCLSLASYLLLMVTIGISTCGRENTLKLYVSQRIEVFMEFCKKVVAME